MDIVTKTDNLAEFLDTPTDRLLSDIAANDAKPGLGCGCPVLHDLDEPASKAAAVNEAATAARKPDAITAAINRLWQIPGAGRVVVQFEAAQGYTRVTEAKWTVVVAHNELAPELQSGPNLSACIDAVVQAFAAQLASPSHTVEQAAEEVERFDEFTGGAA